MMTRQTYINSKDPNAHRRYYAQFVTDEVKAQVRAFIGIKRLEESKDPHFNDIPLHMWDSLRALSSFNKLKEHGDYLTLGGKVCIYKEAAHQLTIIIKKVGK